MSQYPASIFNDTDPAWTTAGGDSRSTDVNAAYAPSVAHQVWLMMATILVLPIVPGIGLFYSGEARRQSAMSILWQSLAVLGIIPFQWFLWGYSLTYASNASPFIGTMTNFGLRNVVAAPTGYMPEILFCLWQCMYCLETVIILVGGAFERCRLLPSIVFCFCWATVVYCPVACWTWNANGWLYTLGALDYAGGGPVHIASGVGALALALFLGKRVDACARVRPRPHSPVAIYIGTVFIWFGWFGFNGGAGLTATVRTGYVLVNTNLAAATGVMGWNAAEFVLYRGCPSVAGSCRGVMVGLVAITPAAGYVPVYFAAVIGFAGAAIVRATGDCINKTLRIDDGLMVFQNHAVGGIAGAVMTGLFSANWVSQLDGLSYGSGWVDHNYIQLAYQLAEIAAIVAYTFVTSVALLCAIDRIPGLKFRSEERDETEGLDSHYLANEGAGSHDRFLKLIETGIFDAVAVSAQKELADSASAKQS